VLNVGPHSQRRGLLAAVEEHSRARHVQRRRLTVAQPVDELTQRALTPFALRGDDLAAALPRDHDGEHSEPISSGSHAP